MPESPSTLLGRIANEFTDRVQRGERPSVEEFAARHPEAADLLREVLPLLLAVPPPDPAATPAPHETCTTPALPGLPGYEVVRELGRGGMGVVYEARHLALGRPVALKMILAGDQAGPEAVGRFLAEAELAARLQHPHIAQVFDLGTHAGRPFFAMELVAGPTLAARLGGRPLPPAQAAVLLRTLAAAVQHAHERGVVHRDLKPANVLLLEAPAAAPDGSAPPAPWPLTVTPKIVDFGLARRVEADSGLTATGAVLGTPSYMAPEQARGDGPRVGPAADVWALGAILYECLTGRPPFQAASAFDTLRLVLEAEPVPPRQLNPAVPVDLETVCLKCLHKDPARRYATAAALAEELGRVLDGRPVQARPAGRAERARRWARRHPAAALALTLTALLAAVVTGGSLVLAFQASEAEQAVRQQRDAADQERQGALANQRRAEEAEGKGEDRLLRSKLEEARALRLAAQLDARSRSLAALREALALARKRGAGPELLAELRDEYVACLAQTGVRTGAAVRLSEPTQAAPLSFDADFQLVARREANSDLVVCRVADGVEVTRLVKSRWYDARPVLFRPGNLFLVVGNLVPLPNANYWSLEKARPVFREGSGPFNFISHGTAAVSFAPDGTRVALGRNEGVVTEVELEGFTLVNRWKVGPKVGAVAYAPDGRRVAACGTDHKAALVVFEPGIPEPVARLPLGRVDQPALAWSACGRFLAAAFPPQNNVLVWDVTENRRVLTFAGHAAPVTALALHPGGELAASTGQDGTTRLWNFQTGREVLRIPQPLTLGRFSRDGRFLGYLRTEGQGRLLEVEVSAVTRALGRGRTPCVRCGFSPDGRLVFAALEDGVRFWDRRDGRMLAALPYPGAAHLAWSPDGRCLIMSARGGIVGRWRWDVSPQPGGRVRFGPPRRLNHPELMGDLAFTADGRLVTARGSVLDPENGKPVVRAQGASETNKLAIGGSLAVSYEVDRARTALTFVQFWDTRTGAKNKLLKAEMPLDALFWGRPDGRQFAAGDDTEYRFWDVATWQIVRQLPRLATEVGPLAWSPDGQVVAVEQTPGVIVLRDAATFAPLVQLRQPAGERAAGLHGLHFSPDGTALLVQDRDHHGLRLWDLRELRRELAAVGLDWDRPPFPPAPAVDARPLEVEVVGADLLPKKK
jgi:WD40 repeat protein